MASFHVRQSPARKAEHDATTPQPKRNSKNEIIQWSSSSDDGKLLRQLVSNGCIKPDMTAGSVRKKYSMFNVYSYQCFNSALSNVRKSLSTELKARSPQTGHGGEGGKMKARSGFDIDDDDDDDTTFKMSKMAETLGDDDTYSYDTRTHGSYGGGKSVSFRSFDCHRSIHSTPNKPKISREEGSVQASPLKASLRGTQLFCSLPYIIDYWYDRSPNQRASIQIQLLSFSDKMLERVSYRVSTNQDEFVVVMPCSPFMGEPSTAFSKYILEDLGDDAKKITKPILDWHPKANARRLMLSKLKTKSSSANRSMEFRIKLKFKCSLQFATVDHDDPYFYGHKIIHYPDESKQLHKELVGDENCATMASWLLFVPILELTPLKPGFGISSEITTDRLTIIMTRTMMKPNPSARLPYLESRS